MGWQPAIHVTPGLNWLYYWGHFRKIACKIFYLLLSLFFSFFFSFFSVSLFSPFFSFWTNPNPDSLSFFFIPDRARHTHSLSASQTLSLSPRRSLAEQLRRDLEWVFQKLVWKFKFFHFKLLESIQTFKPILIFLYFPWFSQKISHEWSTPLCSRKITLVFSVNVCSLWIKIRNFGVWTCGF